MKVSYGWLKELLPTLTLTPKEVAETLTLHSFETVIDHEFALDPNIRVVEILKIEPHPGADRLRLATVTDGKEEIKVVCGAPNIEVGQKVPYSPPGTNVLDKNGQPFTLTVANIRGVESPGMLNSKKEIGLGDDHGGIFVVPAETQLGSALVEHFPADTILECDVTPNRAHDCLSHVGIARELAAILQLEVTEPEEAPLPKAKSEDSGWEVVIDDAKSTPRYMNLVASVPRQGASPLWLQHKLHILGLRPISVIVDITNYVMLEMGNPTHAFAADKLPGKTMGTRFGKENEALSLLDGGQVSLNSNTLVVTSNDMPVALAGIMGGSDTQVDTTTKDIVVEIANFHPYTIQKTAFAVTRRTEAANRFIKGIEPARVEKAAARLIHLLSTITGAEVSAVVGAYPTPTQSTPIPFDTARIKKISRVDIPHEEIVALLKRLRFTVEEKEAGVIHVIPPADRLDISKSHDVAEEVIRLVGLRNIPSTPIPEDKQGVTLPHAVMVREALRNQLAAVGFTETYNYSLEPSSTARILGIDPVNHLELTNPPAPELKYLRTSLMPGLVAAMMKNKAEILREGKQRERALFEIGHTYVQGDGGTVEGVQEEEYVAGICIGDPAEILKSILATLNVPAVSIGTESDTNISYGRAHAVVIGGTPVGYVGTLSSHVVKKMKYAGSTIGYFDLNVTQLIKHIPETAGTTISLAEIKSQVEQPIQFMELNKYPSVFRDISVLVDASLPTEKIQGAIEEAGGDLVADTELFDEYEPDDDPSAKGAKKSLAFHIEYTSPDHTLTQEEVEVAHKNIIEQVAKELGGEVR